MSQKRILIVLNGEQLNGISMTDEAGVPRPVDAAAINSIAPDINTELLSQIDDLNLKLASANFEGNPTYGVSKLTIMRRLGDKWPTLKAALATLPESVQDAWSLAQEISIKDELFVAYRAQLQIILDLTDEEFTTLLTP